MLSRVHRLSQVAVTSFEKGQGRATLKITTAAATHAGEYGVTLKNPSGSISSSAKLTVNKGAPTIPDVVKVMGHSVCRS